jgi:hypothetical protein
VDKRLNHDCHEPKYVQKVTVKLRHLFYNLSKICEIQGGKGKGGGLEMFSWEWGEWY